MSGGHFNYYQMRIGDIADRIQGIIDRNDDETLDHWGIRRGAGYWPETITELKTAVSLLRKAHIYAHRIDWLVSCDDSEDSFHRRLKSDLDAARRPDGEIA